MRRRLLTIAIFLLAGAVVNVAVAWVITAVPNWRTWVTSENKVEWPRPVPDHWPERASDRILIRAFGCRLDEYVSVLGDGAFAILIDNAGWPCHALESETWFDRPTGIWSSSGITLPVKMFGRTHTRLPVQPVWPGFVFNSLFYAGILWLLIPGPFVLRRLIRQRRGLCPKCAYPMGEAPVCTECGRKLPQRVRATT